MLIYYNFDILLPGIPISDFYRYQNWDNGLMVSCFRFELYSRECMCPSESHLGSIYTIIVFIVLTNDGDLSPNHQHFDSYVFRRIPNHITSFQIYSTMEFFYVIHGAYQPSRAFSLRQRNLFYQTNHIALIVTRIYQATAQLTNCNSI